MSNGNAKRAWIKCLGSPLDAYRFSSPFVGIHNSTVTEPALNVFTQFGNRVNTNKQIISQHIVWNCTSSLPVCMASCQIGRMSKSVLMSGPVRQQQSWMDALDNSWASHLGMCDTIARLRLLLSSASSPRSLHGWAVSASAVPIHTCRADGCSCCPARGNASSLSTTSASYARRSQPKTFAHPSL